MTITSQPGSPAQACTVANGSGAISADVTNVSIACTTNTYSVGGTVSGLSGTGLVLQLNGDNDLPITANGTFTFEPSLIDGQPYTVSVSTQPSGPLQTCVVISGSGTVVASDVSVSVACTVNRYTVGGTVSGLVGHDMVLNNGTEQLTVDANGSFTFPTALDVGASYEITIDHSPGAPAQHCVVANGTGSLGAANVTNASVTCDAPTYSNNVAAFSIDETTGALTSRGAVVVSAATVQILIEPTGHYAYILADQAASTLRTYTINQTTGALTEVASSAQAMLQRSGGMTFGGKSPHLYVFNPTTDMIHAYALDAATGRPQPLSGSPFPTGGDDLQFLALHPNGRFIYAAPPSYSNREEGVTVFALDSSGLPTRVAGSPFGGGIDPWMARADPTGRYLYVTESEIAGNLLHKYRVDTATGALSAPAAMTVPPAQGVEPPQFDSSGEHVYDVSDSSVLSYGIDHASGALLSSNWRVTHVGGGATVAALDEDATPLEFVSNTVVSTSEGDHRLNSFRLSATGSISSGSITSVASPSAVTIDPSGRFAHVLQGSGIGLYAIDPATSVLTDFGYNINVAGTPAPVTFFPTGRYAYVANKGSTTLRTFVMDTATGDWDSTLANVTLSTAVEEALMHPSGRFLYTRAVANGTSDESRLWKYPVDPATGEVNFAGNYVELGGPVGGWARHPSGNFLYVVKPADDVIESHFIHPGLGNPNTLNSDVPFVANGETGMAIDARGRFLFAITTTGAIQTFAIGTDGRLTALGDQVPSLTQATALAADYSGNYLVVLDGGASRVRTYRVEDNGALIHVDAWPTALSPGVHEVKVSGRLQ